LVRPFIGLCVAGRRPSAAQELPRPRKLEAPMPEPKVVADHYTHGKLLDAIRAGVNKLGKTPSTVRPEDLAPIDEFHIGGREATERFLDQLEIEKEHRVLDVGCGIGGASRLAASRTGSRVTGIDLTPEFVETGNELCRWVGLHELVHLEVGDATDLSLPDGHFDRAFVMHVGMNIAAKDALAAELHRVVRPGGRVGIYDVMRIATGDLTFPVPWATEPHGSSLAEPAVYRSSLEKAGFKVVAEVDRREYALDFLHRVQASTVDSQGPPPLGLPILMGSSAPVKLKNMVKNLSRGLIAPVEMVAEKPG
jgi:SAM-dependent methyltransferase